MRKMYVQLILLSSLAHVLDYASGRTREMARKAAWGGGWCGCTAHLTSLAPLGGVRRPGNKSACQTSRVRPGEVA